jgi:2-hydroxy-3-oxopropionate reductase
MGSLMAPRLIEAGLALSVWNRTPENARDLVARGATLVENPKALGETCDAVITMVSDGPDVEEIALGPDGLLAAPRSDLLWIDCSSIAPGTARALAQAAHDRGVSAVDAPVSGGTVGAASGALSIMVGGSEEAFARARPVLAALGSNIVRVGTGGAGQVAKLVNQLIVGGTIALVAEGLTLAEALGCSPAAVRDALQGGFADSRVLEVHGQRMLEASFAPGFRSELQRKDLWNALQTANAHNVALPTTAVVYELYTALGGIGEGNSDHSGAAILLRLLSGLDDRRPVAQS